MSDITKLIDDMLTHLDKERWISFSKDDSAETFKARDKLRAFGLIEKYNQHSWRLTGDGYKAIELCGFEQWYSNSKRGQTKESSIQVDNLSIVTGDRNNVNQSNLENSPKATQTIKQERKTKTSLIEIVSWIVGIVAGLIAIYQFWLKDILTK